MSWRVVAISKRCKLDYKMGSLVVRNEDGEKQIHIDDISVLLIESTAVSITAYLMSELIKSKVKLIFCDNFHNPESELVPYRGSYDASGKIRSQIEWKEEIKEKVWQNIIQNKIKNQAKVLQKVNQIEKAKQLLKYADEVELGDATNREGHAAKVYFTALFGEEFFRDSGDVRNAVLNYGYTILLSCFNREITASGYLTQLGIWHQNAENPFNLGSDLMESFRPIVDEFAYLCKYKQFDSEEKHAVLSLLNMRINIADSKQFVNNATGIYVRSVFNAIESGDVSKIENWHEL